MGMFKKKIIRLSSATVFKLVRTQYMMPSTGWIIDNRISIRTSDPMLNVREARRNAIRRVYIREDGVG